MKERWRNRALNMNVKKTVITFLVTALVVIGGFSAVLYANFSSKASQWKNEAMTQSVLSDSQNGDGGNSDSSGGAVSGNSEEEPEDAESDEEEPKDPESAKEESEDAESDEESETEYEKEGSDGEYSEEYSAEGAVPGRFGGRDHSGRNFEGKNYNGEGSDGESFGGKNFGGMDFAGEENDSVSGEFVPGGRPDRSDGSMEFYGRDGHDYHDRDHHDGDHHDGHEDYEFDTLWEQKFTTGDKALVIAAGIAAAVLLVWYWILVMMWAYRKATRLGLKGVVWVWITFFFNLIAILVLYLIGLIRGTCSHCGKMRSKGQTYCDRCGAPFEKDCPYCGAKNKATAKFCAKCGKPMDGTPEQDPKEPDHPEQKEDAKAAEETAAEVKPDDGANKTMDSEKESDSDKKAED